MASRVATPGGWQPRRGGAAARRRAGHTAGSALGGAALTRSRERRRQAYRLGCQPGGEPPSGERPAGEGAPPARQETTVRRAEEGVPMGTTTTMDDQAVDAWTQED